MEPNLEKLSFEKAVQLFKEWGFLVEQGLRPEDVTLILDGPTHRSCYVYTAAQLPQLAAAALRVRWRTRALLAPVLDL